MYQRPKKSIEPLPAASSAYEAATKFFESRFKRPSSKINYEALKEILDSPDSVADSVCPSQGLSSLDA